ncbi:protein of unknown function [Methylorubrum extorquens DM4]|uniref:Uncharacterized protein n=1 Tax=Methylorubrum extorquens (strain DSM 6343 / CIP 106787 / DM4) TaxID=661410 RepID=A0A2P9HAV1_METED|nr:protein of unknown function [Methylorubrum extorquens DM4]
MARTPPGSATFTPASTYSLSLLRSVRIEMPRMRAAWVRLPRQWSRVSRIRSRSTSATVRPTSPRVAASAALAARSTGPEAAVGAASDSPSGLRIASGPISAPCARSTARWIVFSSSRTLPGQGLRATRACASRASGRSGRPFSSAYLRAKWAVSSRMSASRSRKAGRRRCTTLRR